MQTFASTNSALRCENSAHFSLYSLLHLSMQDRLCHEPLRVPARFGSLDPTPLRDSRRTFSGSRSLAANYHTPGLFSTHHACSSELRCGQPDYRGFLAIHAVCNCDLRRNGAHSRTRIIFESFVNDRHHLMLSEGEQLAGIWHAIAQSCYLIGFLSNASACRHAVRHTSSPHD